MLYRFGELTLDLGAGRLEGPQGEIALRPQTFRLLALLVEEAPRVVSQDELLDRVWGTEHLSSNSVRQAVSELRAALGDTAERPRYIATVHRRGYRFVAEVEDGADDQDPMATEGVPAPAARSPATEPSPAATTPSNGRARGRRRPHPLWLAVVVLLVAGAALVIWWRSRGAAPAAHEARLSLAVLPFANLGLDEDEAWIGGAVAEVLRFELATAGRLRLVSGETVARMGQELGLPRQPDYGRDTLAAVGTNLGVEWVVAGAYLPATGGEAGELLLQAQVQRTADGAVIAWAQERCTEEDLSPGATRLARSLQASLGVSGSAVDPAGLWMPDAETLRLYSEALEMLRREESEPARSLLEQALARSPDNPLIHDALSRAYASLGFDARAREESRAALDDAVDLPRALRLAIEARQLALDGRPDDAVARWQALWQFYPDDAENGLQLAKAQRSAGRFREALETLAAVRESIPDAVGDPRISRLEAGLLADLGDFEASRDRALESIAEAAERGAPLLAVDGHLTHAWALGRLGDIPGALAALDRAEALTVQMKSSLGQAMTLGDRAQLLQRTGRLDEAEQLYRRVLDLLRGRGTRKAEATTLNNFASLLLSRNDPRGAISALERSVELKREIGDTRGLVTSLTNLANLHRSLGEVDAAARYLEESVDQARQLGLPDELAASLRSLAYLRLREERYEIARSLFAEALEASASDEAKADSLYGLATVAKKTGDTGIALAHFRKAAESYRRLELPESLAQALYNSADLERLAGRNDEARSGFAEVLDLAKGLDSDLLAAYGHYGLGQVAEAAADLATARREYRLALDLFGPLGQTTEGTACQTALERLGGA
ncbi:MAG: tetratricopeptide repeat protein [Acidobacteria bacterium]|nr:tetratricopeptide repeat protein [Acidobacteriota bacterium]